ncbi:MAG: hypothetical protein ABW133_23690 [Polyangiaceae bacterium]
MPRLNEVYPRERLFRRLDLAARGGVAWIAAPAGTGKTSLVATYLEARGLPALWYNVDARDSDVANLFHYLSLSARAAAKKRNVDLPQFSLENQGDVLAFARGFFAALGAARPIPSILVIDDYQEAGAELFDAVLREAAYVLPRGITTIVVSRTEPPKDTANIFSRGNVISIDWDDLRFTPPEIAGLVRVYRPDLPARERRDLLPQIVEIAGGWPAALTLLLQTKRLVPLDPHGLEDFSERLFDYFATEIFDKAEPEERDFLLKTSVVPRFTPDLASDICERPDASEILLRLERRSFLTQRLGGSGAYRYHPLLRGFLLRRAVTTFGQREVEELHRRAGRALARADLPDEAIEQFQASRDVDAIAEIVLRLAPSYIMLGKSRTIESWIERLPADRIAHDGWLTHWAAVSCLTHDPSRARELHERAYELFSTTRDAAGLYGTCAAAIQAVIFESIDHSRCDPWIDRFDSLEGDGISCPPPLRPLAVIGMLNATVFRRPNESMRAEWPSRATAMSEGSDDVALRITIGGALAVYSVLHEGLGRAAVVLEMLRESARQAETSAIAALTLLHADAMYAWAGGDHARCIDLVREGLALATRTGIVVWNDHLAAIGVASAQFEGQFEIAHEFLSLSRSSAEKGRNFARGGYYFFTSWEAFLRDDTTRAARLGELARESGEVIGFPLAQASIQVALSKIFWRTGRKEEAGQALAAAREPAHRAGYATILFSCDLVESDHEWDENREHARACLSRGLELGEKGGYHAAFWIDRGMFNRAATRALEGGLGSNYVRAMIVKLDLTPPFAPVSPEGWSYRHEFRALGAFEMATGITPARTRRDSDPEPRGMPRKLLLALIALGGRGVRDTELMDALWPDKEGDAGRRVFDTTLHRLRRQLGSDDVVRLVDRRVHLDARRCWVDLWAFDHAVEEIERCIAERAPASALVPLGQKLVALYRGALFAGEDESWLRRPRQQWAARFRRAVERLAAALDSTGEIRESAELRQRALPAFAAE